MSTYIHNDKVDVFVFGLNQVISIRVISHTSHTNPFDVNQNSF